MKWFRQRRAKRILRRKEGLEFSDEDRLVLLGDSYGYPRQWIVCEFCAAHSWIFPPHMFESCPLPTGIADSAGLKMDTERMTQVRLGTHLEEATRRMNDLMDRSEGGDDE